MAAVLLGVAGCTFAPPEERHIDQPAAWGDYPKGPRVSYLEISAESLIARRGSGAAVGMVLYDAGPDAVLDFVAAFLGQADTELLLGCTEYPLASTWPGVGLRIQYARSVGVGDTPPLVVVAESPRVLAPLMVTTSDGLSVGEDATDWLSYFHDNSGLTSDGHVWPHADGSLAVRYDAAPSTTPDGPWGAVAELDTYGRITELRAPTRPGSPSC